MGRGKKYQPEQVVNLLRQIEVAIANGKTTALANKINTTAMPKKKIHVYSSEGYG